MRILRPACSIEQLVLLTAQSIIVTRQSQHCCVVSHLQASRMQRKLTPADLYKVDLSKKRSHFITRLSCCALSAFGCSKGYLRRAITITLTMISSEQRIRVAKSVFIYRICAIYMLPTKQGRNFGLSRVKGLKGGILMALMLILGSRYDRKLHG